MNKKECRQKLLKEMSKKNTVILKIYNDGGHYIGTKKVQSLCNRKRIRNNATELDGVFDYLYMSVIDKKMTKQQLFEFFKQQLVEVYCFDDSKQLDEYIDKKIKSKYLNFHNRVKRFRRKAFLNKWNYFCTFTYDGKKHTADSFKRKLRKCLCNLHTRYDWRYMGVFEYSPEKERLHFHCLMYVPDGKMIGNIIELKDYSTKLHSMQISHVNSFFLDRFGRNDFTPITATEKVINYILKYLYKTNEKIVYCRHIPTEIFKRIKIDDIVVDFQDFVVKYVLFDDVICWEQDICHWKYEQMCFG